MKRALLIILIFINIFMFQNRICVAQKPTSNLNALNNQKILNIPFNRDISLKGMFASDSIFFSVDKSWTINALSLNLSYSNSNTIDFNKSSYTVYLNGNPVYSARFNQQNATIKIDLKKEFIKTEANELRLQTYIRSSDDACSDDANPSNWVVLNKQSFVHLEYIQNPIKNTIKNYPFPFLSLKEDMLNDFFILLPDKYENTELTTVTEIIADLGRRAQKNLEIPILRYSEAQKSTKDIIFVGKIENTPKEILDTLTNSQAQYAKDGAIIKLIPSPYNAKKSLLAVISNEHLAKASRLLANDDLILQANSDSILIGNEFDESMKQKPLSDKLTLDSLGYNDLNFKGSFRQQSTVSIKLPKNRVPKSGGKMAMYFRYSKNINFDTSLFSVYINNKPVFSTRLSPINADNDKVEFMLPENTVVANYYDIKFAFDFKMPESYCAGRIEDTPWGFVCKESYIFFPTATNQNEFFENYPAPFIADGEWNNLSIVLPDKITSNDLGILSLLAGFMGTEKTINTGELEVLNASDFSNAQKTKNLIVIGTPATNSLIKKINENLWLKYNNGFTGFVTNEKKTFLEEYASNIATLQFITSPFNKGRSALVLTSPKEDMLKSSARYLSKDALFGELYGDCAILNKDGKIQNFYFKGKEDETKFEKIVSKQDVKLFIMFFILLVGILLIALVVFIIKHRKNEQKN